MAKAMGAWYFLAATTLHKHGVKDEISGESFLTFEDTRAVLGESLRVSKWLQGHVIQELVAAGYAERVNKQTLRFWDPMKKPLILTEKKGAPRQS
jgi:hypothetical protein